MVALGKLGVTALAAHTLGHPELVVVVACDLTALKGWWQRAVEGQASTPR